MIVEYDLTPEEIEKLGRLAKARGRTPLQCIKDFIAACQPGGVGWQHPSKAKPLDEGKSDL